MTNIKIDQSVLTKEECFSLLNTAKQSEELLRMGYVLCLTMLTTGMRNSEIVQLTYTQIDLEQNIIYLNRGHDTNKEKVRITNDLVEVLHQYLNNPIFLDWISKGNEQVFFMNGKPFNKVTLNTFIKRLAKEDGIEKIVTARCLRNAFGYMLIQSGLSLLIVQKLMRLKTIKSLEGYLQVNNY
ncbi:tyrosine-type recombinase/integrase [Paenibacillus agaridevorans]|uniref:tyrosine-type recombinase/integrase n=1 Tax=Paenibacillus agaridevorans TaxID=171404 RepID=UPI001BE40BEB|nr:site-specific integrase [Paenibacillus agaridevorans]